MKQHELQLTAGNIFEKLHEPAEMPAILEKIHKSCRILKEHGARFFTIVPHIAEERVATAGRPAEVQKLPDDRWKQFMQAIVQVAEVTKSYGIQCTLHPHSGAWLETEDEIIARWLTCLRTSSNFASTWVTAPTRTLIL